MSRSPIPSRSRAVLRLAVVGLAAAGLAVGCGGDDDTSNGGDAPTASPTAAPADANAGSSGSTNPDVERFCSDAEAVADELAEVLADPTSGDMAALQQRVTELTASAAQLTSASGDDAARISECTQLMSDALTG